MTDQEELIAQMGATLRSIHADKYDETKDEKYWRDFALSMRRREAELAGLGKTFDEAVEKGCLREFLHQMANAKHIAEAKINGRIYFGFGVVVGVLLVIILSL